MKPRSLKIRCALLEAKLATIEARLRYMEERMANEFRRVDARIGARVPFREARTSKRATPARANDPDASRPRPDRPVALDVGGEHIEPIESFSDDDNCSWELADDPIEDSQSENNIAWEPQPTEADGSQLGLPLHQGAECGLHDIAMQTDSEQTLVRGFNAGFAEGWQRCADRLIPNTRLHADGDRLRTPTPTIPLDMQVSLHRWAADAAALPRHLRGERSRSRDHLPSAKRDAVL